MLFGTPVAETILASVHVRAHQQAGHMDASDLIKALQNTLRGGGRPHMGLGHLALKHARLEDVQLRFRHRSRGPKRKPIAEVAHVVHAICAADERIDHGIDLKQLAPVPARARQARLNAEHEADMAEPDLGDEALEAGTAFDRSARASLSRLFLPHARVGSASELWVGPKIHMGGPGPGC